MTDEPLAAAPTGAVTPPPWRELGRDGRLGMTAGLILVEFVAGIQSLVVTAVMPKVLADLGGIALYGWVFTGYFVTGMLAIPIAGHQSDRAGPARPFFIGCCTFAVGTLLASVAVSMWMLVLARVIQGYGGALFYTVGYSAIAKVYPERMRPRMIALVTFVWVVSGLIGPSYGALVATTVGWRWAFASVIPLIVLAAVLVIPRFMAVPRAAAGDASLRWRAALVLTGGTAILVGSLTTITVWTLLLAPAGLALFAWALQRILPRGWLTVRPGFPAVVAVSGLVNLAFFGTDAFIPLMLTRVRGTSVLVAGIAVTTGTLGWCVGAWWQSRVMATQAAVTRFVRDGAALMVLGLIATGSVLTSLPLWICYVGWTAVGVGIGLSYSAVMVATMDSSVAGAEGAAMSARFISGRAGIVLSTGLAGAAVALGSTTSLGLRGGLAIVIALGLVPALLTFIVAPRVAG